MTSPQNAYTTPLVVSVVAIAWVSFFWYQVRHNPVIEFLYPVSNATWILYPTRFKTGILPNQVNQVIFRHYFSVNHTMFGNTAIELAAMTDFTVIVNGSPAGSSKDTDKRNWKRMQKVHIGPWLKKGQNVIDVVVTNHQGPPALILAACGENRGDLRSNRLWKVREPTGLDWKAVALAGTPQPLRISSLAQFMPIIYTSFLLYVLYIVAMAGPAAVTILRRFRQHCDDTFLLPSSNNNTNITTWAFLSILLVIVVLNTHNAASYPTMRGFDAPAHLAYVQYVATHWRAPLATEGWEMAQPPLYYYIAAILYRLASFVGADMLAIKSPQYLSAAAGTATIVLVFATLRQLFPNQRLVQLFGTSIAAFLPVQLVMNPRITNDVMVGFVTSVAVYLIVYYAFRKVFKPSQAILIGLITGCALMSKHTALPLLGAASVIMTLRVVRPTMSRSREVRCFLAFSLGVLVVVGWFYARNLMIFGNAFIAAWNEASGFYFEQHPGFRWLSFYLDFGSSFFVYPTHNRWISFWDGMYSTLWADGHGKFATQSHQMTLMRVGLWLALLPTVAIVLGGIRSVSTVVKNPFGNPHMLPLVMVFVGLTLAIYVTMRVPYYSVVNARHYLALTIPFSIFAGQGLYAIWATAGGFRICLWSHLALLYLLIAIACWYQEGVLL